MALTLIVNAQPNTNDEIQAARKAFRALMHSAHPQPAKNIKDKYNPIPLSKEPTLSFFLNKNMIDQIEDTQAMQNESSIAVNPLNPKMLIGSSVDYRQESSTWVYFSEDGAKTWVNYNLGHPFPGWRSTNDPSVAYGPDGFAYLVYGGFGKMDDTSHGENFGENGVFISVSSDGGKTWKPEDAHIPVILHKGTMTMDSLFEDKYYISVDNAHSSPYRNHLYIPWKRVSPRDSATQIVISKSTDRGRTWSVPIGVSPRKSGTSQDTTYGQSFPLVATGPNGEVYLVWNDGIEHGVGFSKSLDGGMTWSEPRIIKRYNIFGITNNIANKPDDEPIMRHTIKEVVRAETYPVVVVDTTNSERRGTIYLTWAGDNIPNVYFAKSIDGGDTWSNDIIIHSDTTNDQFWQWMAVDPMNGDLAVMYLDSRDDEENLLVECFVSYTRDGGETWVDRKISDFTSDLRRNPFYNHFAGDYSGMAFFNGFVYPSWVDMRNAVSNIFDSDVFTSIVNVWAPAAVDNFKANTIPEELDVINLTWDFNNTKSFGQPMNLEDFHFLITRDEKKYEIESNLRSFKDAGLENHKLYHYKIYVVSDADTSIFRADSAYSGGSKELAVANIISVKGNDNNEINLKLLLPEFRADNVTKLINLSKAVMFDSKDRVLAEFDLSKEDAGKEKELVFNAPLKGYYKFYIKVFDDNAPANSSSASNQVATYTGLIESSYLDNFDSGFRPYNYTETWNTSSNFYRSSPNSLTDSPDANYKKMIDNHITMYPVIANEGEEVNISFWHAALITKRDTGRVEISIDWGENWTKLAGYTIEDYSYWSDGVLDQQDWKYENIRYKPINLDTILVRFNIVTKLGASDHGWYIDDLNIYNGPVSVNDDIDENDIVIYPNPASEFIYINNADTGLSRSSINEIRVFNALGEIVLSFPNHPLTSSQRMNIELLPSGVYFVRIANIVKRFVKI